MPLKSLLKELVSFTGLESISLPELMESTRKTMSTAVLPTGWKLIVTSLLLFSLSPCLLGQEYFVSFKNKSNTPYSIEKPSEYLSTKSIVRRKRYGIAIDERDLPVDPNYIAQIASLEEVFYFYSSKWLNGAVFSIRDSLTLFQIEELEFVKAVAPLRNYYKKRSANVSKEEDTKAFDGQIWSDTDYGPSYHQANMLNVPSLHNKGYRGKGMTIAVLDGGFNDLKKLSHFDSLQLDFRLLAQRDYVDLDHTSVDGSWHGMHVMSTMASNLQGQLIGTAPEANYILIRTEDSGSETPIEELNWVVGAEFADSMGADILNTSLGYTNYYHANGIKDSLLSYEWEDLDGNTSYITRASDIAASRGLLVVNSAGNSGNCDWKYIGMPADGDSVLAIGALDSMENRIGFSSFGLPSSPQIKPNIAAMGHRIILAHKTSEGKDTLRIGSGTSFSGPIIAGAIACLWQAKPELSNMEIFDIVQRSADRFNNPDTAYGYGLPDFEKALDLLSEKTVAYSPSLSYPNPFQNYLMYSFRSEFCETLSLELHDLQGNIVTQQLLTTKEGLNEFLLNTSTLREGLYILVAKSKHHSDRQKLMKETD